MNKTVNINIGGIFFNVDENAFQKLSRYFDAIKRSLSNSSGQDEIMKDIEMRVAELLEERQKSDKHVVNLQDVDAVVSVMGQPEDYRIDEENEAQNSNFSSSNTTTRKLYRDKEAGILGGVCAGLGHYFGIDKIWIRLGLLTLVSFYGTGFLAYFILWIVMPEAKTTSEKIEMTGDPVNISNIEKKVREEFESVSNKFKNGNYDELGNKIKNGAERVGSNLGDALISIFKAFSKVIGGITVITGATGVIAFFIFGVIMIFSSDLPKSALFNNFSTPLGLETPLWLQGILYFFVVGIPMFFLLILGLKLLTTNLKATSSTLKYTLLVVWIVALCFLVTVAIKNATQYAFEAKSIKKEMINLNATDTLFIKFKNNDFYSKNISNRKDYELVSNENGKDIIYSNNVSIEILKTDESFPYFQIAKFSKGKSSMDAKNQSEKISYNYKIEGNHLIFDNYLLSDLASTFGDQHIEIYLYLPKGILLKPDSSVENFDDSDDDYFNLHFSDTYTYRVGEKQIKCLNCPDDENSEYNDVENDSDSGKNTSDKWDNVIDSTSTLQIDEDGIVIKKNGKKSSDKEIESVKINKDGITIKTK